MIIASKQRLVGWLAGAALLAPAQALGGQETTQAPARKPAAPAVRTVAPSTPGQASTGRPITVTKKAKRYYRAAWGVDKLRVSRVASGQLLRFTFRVTDPAQAAPLIDRKLTPSLYAQRSHAVLSVPVMEKIGPLRQVGSPKAGQDFWVAFSNKGNLVKSGDRVNVTVGNFHADGLMVE